MRRVAKIALRPRMRHMYSDLCPVFADSIELLHDPDEDIRVGANMLKAMNKGHLIRRRRLNRPGKRFNIHQKVRLAIFKLVDVHKTVILLKPHPKVYLISKNLILRTKTPI